MAINVVGLVGIIVFYILILGIGLWAAWKKKSKKRSDTIRTQLGRTEYERTTEDVILAGRNLGLFVGAMTMTG